MKKCLSWLSGALIAAAIICLFDHSQVRAQEEGDDPVGNDVPETGEAIPPMSPDAVKFSDGTTIVNYTPDSALVEKNDDGKSDKLPGLAPDQIVDVTMRFGVAKAGTELTASALDGGTIIVPAGGLVADENGDVHFQFQVGHEPGLYQVSLHDDTHEMGMQFWVIDASNPDNNPKYDLPPESEPEG